VPSPIICLVTGGGTHRALVSLISEAAVAGVDLIQIREPSLDDRALLTLTRDAIETVGQTAARVVVNDRLDIAVAAHASGAHLRGESFSAARLRPIVPPGFLIGRSVHDVDQAIAAAASGCDYLIFGTVFPSRNKPPGHPVAGLGQLSEIATAVRIPVLAIGGISTENAVDVINAGAAGVAGIDLFRSGVSVKETVSTLRRSFDT
jgi:thiamine-phosphate pyrophosphorylase